MGLFEKMKKGLKKTRGEMSSKVNEAFLADEKVNNDLFETLEEILITADVGMTVSLEVVKELKERIKSKKIKYSKEAKEEFKTILIERLAPKDELKLKSVPSIILLIGVNGAGKTTSIGKLAYKFSKEGQKIVIGAADTFRAAAVEQLEQWAQKSGAKVIKHSEGSDPASVVYDAIISAKSKGADIVICDTAGRLHNKQNLMNELKKLKKVVDSAGEGLDVETLLVIDASTGQNGINQAKSFKESSDISGVILTKLDGTAKGGIVIAIKSTLGIPIRYVGLGEGEDDLYPFDPKLFVDGLFSEEDR